MGHVLKSYAWLLGDGVLVCLVLYELYSLRSKPADKQKRDGDPPPS